MFNLEYPWLNPVILRLPPVLPDAVLIRGQAGVGKNALALALARGVLCEAAAKTSEGCGACAACHLFAAGTHPDFRKIEPTSEDEEPGADGAMTAGRGKRRMKLIPVPAIRDIVDFVGASPYRGTGKVIVISPAEAMNPSAANALLKMLEEPPSKTFFMLVCHQPHKLPATILSRCFQLPVRTPAIQQSLQWLRSRGGPRSELALSMGAYAPLAAAELLDDEAFWQARTDLVKSLGSPHADPLELAGWAERLEPPTVGCLLGMWAYDIVATQAGAVPRFHRDSEAQIARLAKITTPERVCQWNERVLDYARAAYHPLNRRLALEALFANYPGIASA